LAPRRFPPPWTVEELDACFVVTDSAGQQLAYVYFEDGPGRRSAAKLLSKKAQRIAVNIAKLPGLMRPCATCFEFNVVMLIPRQQILALGNHL
jgi:hypothetical protein